MHTRRAVKTVENVTQVLTTNIYGRNAPLAHYFHYAASFGACQCPLNVNQQNRSTLVYTNDLHDALLRKNEFWKCWRAAIIVLKLKTL